MIPFVVVVRDELADGATPRALADQDHALEAGFLDGAHEALRVGVQVRRAGDAIAEAEADQDLPGDPHLMLRLSAQFFRLTPSSQLVTLLHETIRMSLELTGKRLQQADDLSQGHFQGKTRSEQAFETQRIELARGLYLFPDEVMAEKHLQHPEYGWSPTRGSRGPSGR